MRKVEQFGSLRFSTLRLQDYVRGPRLCTEDLATAEYWAGWLHGAYGQGDEQAPDPVVCCERAGIRAVTRPRAEMAAATCLWPGMGTSPTKTIVVAQEACSAARRFHSLVARQMAEIIAKRYRVRRVNPKEWNRTLARAFLVPAAHLRDVWEATGHSFEAVCGVWNNVPPTALAKRVGDRLLTDVWIYNQLVLRYASVRPRSARPTRASRSELLVSRLSDGPNRVVVLAAA